MIYKGITYTGMRNVFDKALDIARNNPQEADNFLKAYAESILKENADCNTMEQAVSIAQSNLGYFSGYCSREVSDLIYKTYNVNHPIFG